MKRIAFESDLATVKVMASASSRSGKRPNRRRVLGGLFLAIAVLALLNRYLPFRSEQLILPLLGAGFTTWALFGRVPGLLVPGGVLLGIGLGTAAQRFYGLGAGTGSGQAMFLFCLAIGFLLITLLSLASFRQRVLWPLWPASFIALAAGMRLMGSAWQEYLWRVLPYWPFALLVIALWLLIWPPGNRSKS